MVSGNSLNYLRYRSPLIEAEMEASRRALPELQEPDVYVPEMEGAVPEDYRIEELPDEPQQPTSSFGQAPQGQPKAPELQLDDRSSRSRYSSIRAPFDRAVQAVGGRKYERRGVKDFLLDLGEGALRSVAGGGSLVGGAISGALGDVRQAKRDRRIAEEAARYQAQDSLERQRSQDALTVEQRKSEIQRRADLTKYEAQKIENEKAKRQALDTRDRLNREDKAKALQARTRAERDKGLREVLNDLEGRMRDLNSISATDPTAYNEQMPKIKAEANEIRRLLEIPESETHPIGREAQLGGVVKQDEGGYLGVVKPGEGGRPRFVGVQDDKGQPVKGRQPKGGRGPGPKPKENKIKYDPGRMKKAYIQTPKGERMHEGDPRLTAADADLLKRDREARQANKSSRAASIFGSK